MHHWVIFSFWKKIVWHLRRNIGASYSDNCLSERSLHTPVFRFAEPATLWFWTQWAFASGSENSVSLLLKCPSALTHLFYFCMTLTQFWSMIFGSIQIVWAQRICLSKLTYNHIPIRSPWADGLRVAVSPTQTNSLKNDLSALLRPKISEINGILPLNYSSLPKAIKTCWISREENCNAWEMKKDLYSHVPWWEKINWWQSAWTCEAGCTVRMPQGGSFCAAPLVKGSIAQTRGYNLWLYSKSFHQIHNGDIWKAASMKGCLSAEQKWPSLESFGVSCTVSLVACQTWLHENELNLSKRISK